MLFMPMTSLIDLIDALQLLVGGGYDPSVLAEVCRDAENVAPRLKEPERRLLATVLTSGLLRRVNDARESRDLARSAIRHYSLTADIDHLLTSFISSVPVHTNEPFKKRAQNHRIERAVTFVQNNLDGHLMLSAVANSVGLSKWHFSREFKSYTGGQFGAFVRAQRLARAEHLLLSTTLIVKEVAAQCGFRYPSDLTRQFRSRFGRPPSRYRKSKQILPPFNGVQVAMDGKR